MASKTITYDEYRFLMNRIAYWLISNNKKIKMRDVYTHMGKAYKLSQVKSIIKKNKDSKTSTWGRWFMDCAIADNKSYEQFPNYVTGSNGVKYYLNTYVDMNKRVLAYVKAHDNVPPKTVKIQGSNKNNTTSQTTDSTLKKCYDAFGKFTKIDEFLEKIQGRGYAYYYNSIYNTATTISRIKNRQGVNCTDSAQLTYRVALALGYTVQFVHVRCRASGDGHVRLRLKAKGSDNWFYRDPASVLDGGSVTSNWCSDGTVLAYNPAWVLADVME